MCACIVAGEKNFSLCFYPGPCIALVLILGFPVGFPSSAIEFVVSCLSSEPLVADFMQALKDIQSCLRDKTTEASALSLTDRHRIMTKSLQILGV